MSLILVGMSLVMVTTSDVIVVTSLISVVTSLISVVTSLISVVTGFVHEGSSLPGAPPYVANPPLSLWPLTASNTRRISNIVN